MSQTHGHGATPVGVKASITLQAAHASTAANQPPARQPPAGQLPASEPPASQPAPAQTPSQPLLPPGTQLQSSSAAITGPASGSTAQADSPALSTQAQPGSSDVKKGDSTPAEAAGPQGGSPKAEEGLSSPSKQVKMMSGILEVLAREVLNPASTKETRDAAHTCLQVCCFCHEVVSRKHTHGNFAQQFGYAFQGAAFVGVHGCCPVIDVLFAGIFFYALRSVHQTDAMQGRQLSCM